MITAIFNNKMDYTIAYGLWQWDYGQILRIIGIDFSQFNIEVHFSFNEDDDDSTLAIGVVKNVNYESTIMKDGKEMVASETLQVLDVTIPKDFLWNKNRKNYIVYVFLYPTNTEMGHTIKKVLLPVKTRVKPSYPHTAKDEELFHSTIEQINNIYTQIESKTDNVVETLEGWEDLKEYIEAFKGEYEVDDSEVGNVWTKTKDGAEFKPISIEISSNYELAYNKPRIEGVELVGDMSFSQLNLSKITNSDLEEMLKL